jgi:hypothetical protein
LDDVGYFYLGNSCCGNPSERTFRVVLPARCENPTTNNNEYPFLKDNPVDREFALTSALQNLSDLLVDLSVVPIIAAHGYAPDEYPQPASQDTHQQVQDVIGGFLLTGQIVELVVHGSSVFDWRLV